MEKQIKRQKYNPGTLLLAVVVFFLLCFLATGPAYPFFMQNDIDTSFVLNQEIGELSSIIDRGKIGVSDNFHQPFEKTHEGNNFIPFSKNFVEADSIKYINYGQHYGRSSFSGDTKLSNLLYANLKFKMLTDEYTALQREAFTTIDDYAVPFFDLGLKKYRQGFPIESIHRRRASFVNNQRAVLNDVRMSSSKLFGTIEIARLRSTEPLLAVMNSLDKGKTEKRESFDSSKSIPYDTNVAVGMSDKKDGIGVQNGEKLAEDYRRNRSDGDIQLPWLLRVFLSLMEYCFKHKFEGLIYFFMLIFVISVLTGSRTG